MEGQGKDNKKVKSYLKVGMHSPSREGGAAPEMKWSTEATGLVPIQRLRKPKTSIKSSSDPIPLYTIYISR